ncbi:hypothetical protein Aoki45_03500 [Algoriphagus sp. oki45]|uniref:hypothetical protein n=1 Tax=Algoriphagus sp. oki45 TaxID=3067294 RepID=UPI0027E71348|nr:hypothetical protein Aoki45_03500 [Algoriphagus sp. oki45]
MKSFQLIVICGLLLGFSCQNPQENNWKPEPIPFPGILTASLPVLSASENQLLLSFVSPINDSTSALFYSSWDGESWSTPEIITQGQDWFVNWADFPAIVENQGNYLAHILKKSSPATFSYDVQLQAYSKKEKRWKTQMPLNLDSTYTEHGFVSSIAYSDSSYLVTWLDGRNTSGGHDHSIHESAGAMTLRVAEVNLEGKVLWDELLDARTCDCCQTTTALTAEGPIILYRNRSDREIRDIAITRLVRGKWTEPRIIHPDSWEITGCPVNGPKVAALGQTVLASWFTDAEQQSAVKVAFSENSGADFSEAQVISTLDALGRVDVALLNEEEGLVSWMEMAGDSTFLMVKKINREGKDFPKHKVAPMDAGRRSGFPQMEIFGDQVFFAWTITGDQPSIGISAVSMDNF